MSAPRDTPPLALPRLAPRDPDSHKGTYGRALVIGGSTGMAGAVALAGMAALRSGAGLVQLAVPEPCLPTVAGFEPAYMTAPLPADAAGRIGRGARAALAPLLAPATAVGLGPGLGRSAALDRLVAWLYTTAPVPMVVDADALNALADHPDALRRPGGPRVLTPHPGEFARLLGVPTRQALADRQPLADRLAADCGAVVVVKGQRSYVTDGRRWAVNETGNPGMATGGTGDVLTGVVVALLCQGLAPLAAARLGVHVHGLAGDLAAADLGQVSLTARDVAGSLPAAFRSLAGVK